MKTNQVTAKISSIGVENGKSVVRVGIEVEGQSGVKIITIDTNLVSFAKLAALGIQVNNA